MVSYDHFRHLIRAELQRAESTPLQDVAINSSEFGNSLRKGMISVESLCQAMKDEMKPGDIVERERDSGKGLTIRFQLPRSP